MREPAIDSADAWLTYAFQAFKHNQAQAAAEAFRHAIATGDLNDMGRALAYWHMAAAEQSLGHVDASAEALASFAVLAQDSLDQARQQAASQPEAENDAEGDKDPEAGSLMQRFDMARRLAWARAILSATWAQHTGGFGRSVAWPVPVHSATELRYFLDMAPPCSHDPHRHEDPPQQDAGHPQLFFVTLSCPSSATQARYFFQIVSELSQ